MGLEGSSLETIHLSSLLLYGLFVAATMKLGDF